MANGDRTIPGTMPDSPGARPCCMLQPDPIPGTSIDGIYDLSSRLDHHYGAGKWEYVRQKEITGLLYTCSLGFVDLGHSRETTDFTWFYFNRIRRQQKNKTGDTFEGLADFKGKVTIKKDIPDKDHIRVARSIAYDDSVFHEIFTYWVPRVGGHTSSFSPEDLVSNFAGTYIAERAIKALAAGNFGGDFDKAATAELIILLMTTQALPKNKVIEAFNKVKGRWIVGDAFKDPRYLRRRNFNVAPIFPWFVLVDEPACEPLTLPPDFAKSFPADTKTFYEIEYKISSTDLQTIMGGATLKTSEFDREIGKIKAHASQPESAGGYGSDFDKP